MEINSTRLDDTIQVRYRLDLPRQSEPRTEDHIVSPTFFQQHLNLYVHEYCISHCSDASRYIQSAVMLSRVCYNLHMHKESETKTASNGFRYQFFV